ncbi:cell wall-binding repeat-containing protein [Herbiconiux sp. YIM B11900]|uniref:cell wall-binding repeat-containing protein n=1 Tax=Herbiconiux sp. YIM B11900 TaxID=3404131 RepID=UPI003F824AB5
MITISRTSRLRSRAAVIAAAAVGLATALAAPTAASALSPGLQLCPPTVQKIGTAYSEDFFDSHEGTFDVSIIGGALPPGISIYNPGWAGRYQGTPTQKGSYQFTYQTVDTNHGDVQSKTCRVDVVAADSILQRMDGDDRYDVAANLALQMLAYGPTEKGGIVYLASGENFSDALSASAVAAQHDAPLLLTSAGHLPAQTSRMITILESTQIVVVGGENSINASVVAELTALRSGASITRIAGADRFEVSRNLISDTRFGAMPSTKLYVATGLKFPDALSASPAAAKAKTPVLLVNGGATELSAAEKTLLTGRGVKSATVFGGEDTLSAGVASSIKTVTGAVNRIEGDDRFIVSANVTAANYTSPADTIYFATGATYPDALAGGVLAGVKGAPILLTQKSCVAQEVADQVRALKPKHIVLLGGPNSLDANLENLPVC